MPSWRSSARNYSRRIPVSFVRGEGAFLFDSDDNDYLDFLTGAGVSTLGHAHPVVMNVLKNYDVGFLSHLDLLTQLEETFVEQLLPILPFRAPDDVRVHFCAPTGSDAVEAALKLARIATGRSQVWAFAGSYHGGTQGALSVTSSKHLRSLSLHSKHDVVFFPFPTQSIFSPQYRTEDDIVDFCTFLLQMALDDDHSGIDKPAAIIIEPIQGEGGVHVAPKRFMSFLRHFCDQNAILLICDEVQSGFGRTGNWFACNHYEVEPDVICLSKGIGAGLPIALIAFRSKWNTWPAGSHIGTFRGPSVSIACATEVIRFARESLILDNVNKMGCVIEQGLSRLQSEYPSIKEIRRLGLFVGVEFYAGHTDFADRIARLLFEYRLIAECAGRGGLTLKLLPRLNLNLQEVEQFWGRFESVLRKLV